MKKEAQGRTGCGNEIFPPLVEGGESWPDNYVDVNRRSYDALADEYRARVKCDEGKDQELVKPFVRILRRRFAKQEIRVLDMGCGAGLNLKIFANEGFTVVGIDISARMLEVARETCPQAMLIQGDILTHPIPEKSYHGVFAKAIIHLFEKQDALRILARIHDILRPGGVFYVTSTTEVRSFAGLRPKKDYCGGHSRYRRTWTEDEMSDAISSCGFQILETSYNLEPLRNKRWFNIWAERAQ